jgi:hypothetical protein
MATGSGLPISVCLIAEAAARRLGGHLCLRLTNFPHHVLLRLEPAPRAEAMGRDPSGAGPSPVGSPLSESDGAFFVGPYGAGGQAVVEVGLEADADADAGLVLIWGRWVFGGPVGEQAFRATVQRSDVAAMGLRRSDVAAMGHHDRASHTKGGPVGGAEAASVSAS